MISDLSQDGLAVFRRKHCGFVFQQIYLVDGMSVMDNVLAAGLLAGKGKQAVLERARELFAAVGISDEVQKKFPAQISGGEAQRVKLATELSRKSTGKTLYILDEPTTGLHIADIHKLLEVLNRLVTGGDSVLVIEHNMDVIKSADYIIDLGPEGGKGGGRVVAAGTPEEIIKVKKSYTGQFLKKFMDRQINGPKPEL